MKETIKSDFNPAFPPYSERIGQEQLDCHRTVAEGHGRLETRELQASNRLVGHLTWPGFAQAIRIERTTIEKGETTTEVTDAITSLSRQRASAADLLAFNRGH